MMEAVSNSKTSVNFYQTTRHSIPEDSHLQMVMLLTCEFLKTAVFILTAVRTSNPTCEFLFAAPDGVHLRARMRRALLQDPALLWTPAQSPWTVTRNPHQDSITRPRRPCSLRYAKTNEHGKICLKRNLLWRDTVLMEKFSREFEVKTNIN
jgi:hypothetical protein